MHMVALVSAVAEAALPPVTNRGHSLMATTRRSILIIAPVALAESLARIPAARAASGRQIDADASRALRKLYSVQRSARNLGARARAILIFPTILKAGFLVGGQGGNGALRIGGKTVGYFNIAAASFGLQAGAQTFSYAMFFMTDTSLKYLQDSDGWAIGTGPSVVIVDKGLAGSLTSTTLTQDVYAVPFGQRGLMAGIGLEGSKITHIHPTA
jgi:lipid-binding SYLF domain-containing protein